MPDPSTPSTTLRIATRASPLALWQANNVAGLIAAADAKIAVEIVHVSTTGDRDREGALSSFGGIGVFTREVQKAVLDGRADVAVHSLKDLPTESAAGLFLAAVPEREDTADALVLPKYAVNGAEVKRAGTGEAKPREHRGIDARSELMRLPAAARIGTGSLRRRAQLLRIRPDFVPADVRGNVESRLSKLDAGGYDALVLAVAGLSRLGLEDRVSVRLDPPLMYAAVGQGALGIECRAEDQRVRDSLSRIDHADTRSRVTAERSLLAALRAGCHAPVGAATSIDAGRLTLEAVVLSADGKECLIDRAAAAATDAAALGAEVAERLLSQGAAALIKPH